MYIFNTVTVIPKLPERIKDLALIADNLWWSWNTDFLKLFKLIDKELWENVDKNPIKFLKLVSQNKLEEIIKNKEFLLKYDKIVKDFHDYMNTKNTYYLQKYPKYSNKVIAYFSAEYGLDQTMPLYSGGLGILSGDHMKTASDLGIPLVGIGLVYKEGYFTQKIDANGNQVTIFNRIDIDNMPLSRLKGENGRDEIIIVHLMEEEVYLKVWEVNIGRVKLYLLDADIPENSQRIRELSYKLYGGGRDTRCMQEVILGIGGIRLLDKLRYKVDLYHMNEGHSAFLIFELILKIMRDKNVSFEIAKEIATSKTAFTTHTPVPAGNDIFEKDLILKVFGKYYEKLGLTQDEFLSLGMLPNDIYKTHFNMGVFALKIAGRRNGVSKLHGKVSRELFSEVWPNTAEDESPIDYVTNGVHTTTWLAAGIKKLYNDYLIPYWQDEIFNSSVWKKINDIPDKKLWETHIAYKKKLIKLIEENVTARLTKNGVTYDEILEYTSKLSPEYLTIGFARRFATYKRATLIFDDLERLTQIVNNPKYPVRLVFAGKAHPQDIMGQNLIKRIDEVSKMPQFKGKIILLENYNMALSKLLVSGVDVWLNTPRRPYEASGTSGQKASINGTLNFSVLDGWWDEGYNHENGWQIGVARQFVSEEEQDKIDVKSMYKTLEKEIVPKYYNISGSDKISHEWIKYMKNSITSTAGQFSSHRMLIDYLEKIYMPLIQLNEKYFKDINKVENLVEWKKNISTNFANIQVIEEKAVENIKMNAGEEIPVEISVDFKEIDPKYCIVQAYIASVKEDGKIEHIQDIELKQGKKISENTFKYEGKISINDGGNFAYTYRVLPRHDMILSSQELDTVVWYIK